MNQEGKASFRLQQPNSTNYSKKKKEKKILGIDRDQKTGGDIESIISLDFKIVEINVNSRSILYIKIIN